MTARRLLRHAPTCAARTLRFAKEALDQVEPGRGGWGQVQMEAGMTLEPGDDLGMFVSGVVVADDVNIQLGGDLALDLAQEGQPLLMAMTSGGMSKDLARQIVEGGKQGDRSVTVVIVGLGADMTLVQGETGLTALEGLTLTLLIATEHQRTIGRMEIEANHIPELLFKGQILGKFEALEPMRSDCVSRATTVATLPMIRSQDRASVLALLAAARPASSHPVAFVSSSQCSAPRR